MTIEQEQLYNDFLHEEQIAGHREQGFIGLKIRAKKIFEYCNEKEIPVTMIRIKDSYDFQRWLIENGKKYANNTIRSYITAVTTLFGYLKRNHMIQTNPFIEMKKVKSELKLPRNILKEKEMNIFLKELSNFDKVKGLKNKIGMYVIHVISELMYSTGARITEVANLKVEDVDFEKGIIRINEGKGGYSRIVFLNEHAQKILSIYINDMRELTFNEWNRRNETLFGVKWRSFSKKVNSILVNTSRSLNYPALTSHSFRHSLGFHLLRSGCDIRYIQSILGHKSLSSTEIYTHVDKDDLKEVFNKYHPRSFGAKNETYKRVCN